MGNKTSLNLTALYSENVHGPVLKNSDNKSPLYAVTSIDANDPELKALNRDPEWVRTCLNTYNSPTNIRRLILTQQKVIIQYYKPYIRGGTPTTEGLWRERSLMKYNIRGVIENIARELKNPNRGDLAYAGRNAQNGQNVSNPNGVQETRLTGSALSCIKQPWVLSNLEEIILDETCLLSEKVIHNLPPKIAYQCCYGATGPIASIFPKILQVVVNVQDLNQLYNQLPRLKSITLVGGIGQKISKEVLSSLNCKLGDMVIDKLIKGGLVDQSRLARLNTPAYKAVDTGKLSIRPYYKFDSEVLSKFAAKFGEELAAERDAAKAALDEANKKADEARKTALEKLLDEVEGKSGLKEAKNILSMTIARLNATEREELYQSLTSKAREKYVSLLKRGAGSGN